MGGTIQHKKANLYVMFHIGQDPITANAPNGNTNSRSKYPAIYKIRRDGLIRFMVHIEDGLL